MSPFLCKVEKVKAAESANTFCSGAWNELNSLNMASQKLYKKKYFRPIITFYKVGTLWVEDIFDHISLVLS